MRLLISDFIINAVRQFFAAYPKFSFFFTPPGSTTAVYYTYNFIAFERLSTNVAKFYFTSPCTNVLNYGNPGNITFNPNVDCATPSSYSFYVALPTYTQYATAQASQTTFIVQIRTPPNIT
jgi:hypothetical protein